MNREAHPNKTFELVAGHPALDFVNTLDWRFRMSGPEELLATYEDLLLFAEQSQILTPKQARILQTNGSEKAKSSILKGCIGLRELIADVLYAANDKRKPSSLTVLKLGKYFQDASLHKNLSWKNDRLESVWFEAERDPAFPLWLLSASASDLLISDTARQIRTCDNVECRWLFLDTSKSHTRRWCDMKVCGNRMKARRFRAQGTS